jgi:hypothetical protein
MKKPDRWTITTSTSRSGKCAGRAGEFNVLGQPVDVVVTFLPPPTGLQEKAWIFTQI